MPAFGTGAPESRASAEGAAEASWVGRCVDGRYRIEQQLGAGGMGTVYRARQLALDRCVALKLLRKQHNERWISRKRFEREARALARLAHPHVVTVLDCGIDAGAPFLVMELLEGESLAARLKRGPLAPAEACRQALQLLEGLSFVHRQGLVHRDIKPGNIFLTRTEQGAEHIKLLDFGLAKLVTPSTDPAVTRSGDVFGTPAYMPPEQITGEESDARSDLYCAGLVLFEMIAGRRPFLGAESEMLRQQLVEGTPLFAEVRPEARVLDAVVQRATQKEKSQRFQTAADMSAALTDAARALSLAPPRPLRQTSHPAAHREGASRRPSPGGALTRALRAGAVVVCGLAVAAIALAGGIIYLLQGPQSAEHRVLLQRALASVLGSTNGEERPAAPVLP